MAKEPDNDFALSSEMQSYHNLMIEYGINKTALAETMGVSRSALANKFSAAQAIVDFEEPSSRDRFSSELGERVANYFKHIGEKIAVIRKEAGRA